MSYSEIQTIDPLPTIAFCITCKGRVHHIKQTLPKNLEDNKQYQNLKFILLDYNSPDGLSDYLKENHMDDINSGRLSVYSCVNNEGAFRMAFAKNVAHRLAIMEGADILVNLDADNFTGVDFANYICKHFQDHGYNTFMWARMIPGILNRGISGRMVVPTNAYLNIGGYDERFVVYARDDKDFNERLRRIELEPFEIEQKYLDCIKHPDKLRFKEYPHAKAILDYEVLRNPDECDDSDTTIVNFGKIGICAVTKNFGSDIIYIEPIPTRIFGIGMHKTGTRSLHTALEILGFDSIHWTSPQWTRSIWLEMNALGRSLNVEKHYALSDLPIAILYEKLDKAYPNSKFIFTTRNEVSWLQSVKNHWDRKLNKYRASWDTDCFTHKIHKEIYGQKHFDPLVFLTRFRKHNKDVQDYFYNRPDDLLTLDLDEDESKIWSKLCGFLKKPIPSVPYPKINQF